MKVFCKIYIRLNVKIKLLDSIYIFSALFYETKAWTFKENMMNRWIWKHWTYTGILRSSCVARFTNKRVIERVTKKK